ncbi:MAG: hypothetical protein V9H25_02345 [Candidatus Competibacter sp.]
MERSLATSLYRYLRERIADRMPQQKPQKWAFAAEGDIIIARNPHPVVKPAALPAELQQSIEESSSLGTRRRRPPP